MAMSARDPLIKGSPGAVSPTWRGVCKREGEEESVNLAG